MLAVACRFHAAVPCSALRSWRRSASCSTVMAVSWCLAEEPPSTVFRWTLIKEENVQESKGTPYWAVMPKAMAAYQDSQTC